MSDLKQDWLARLQAYSREERAKRKIENYEARLNVGQNGVPVESAIKGMRERYAAAMVREMELRANVTAFLARLGLSKLPQPFYCRFARKLAKIKDKFRGEDALRQEAEILIMSWEAKGLNRSIMVRMARELFELDLDGEAAPNGERSTMGEPTTPGGRNG